MTEEKRRELKGSSEGGNAFPPTVKFLKEGAKFVGFLDSKMQGKFGIEWSFKIVDGDAFIGRPNGSKDERGNNAFAETDVNPGDIVRLETSKQLGMKLEGAAIGEKIEITFLGWKPNKKTGRSFKDFKIEVVEG